MHLDNLGEAVEIFGKEKVTTHLIIGLGETDYELLTLIQQLTDIGVIPSLFAFTPVKGTLLEDRTSPPLERYRTLQLCRYLIVNRKIRVNKLSFNREGKLRGIDMTWEALKKNIPARSKIFTTVGCPQCNRPYYTERPSGPLYNYPRPLSESEGIGAFAAVQTYLR